MQIQKSELQRSGKLTPTPLLQIQRKNYKLLVACSVTKGAKSLQFLSKMFIPRVSSSIIWTPEYVLKQTLAFNHFILAGGWDLLQDQHQLHRPSRPHSSADRHWEREPGNHRTLAELQRVCRWRPAACNSQGSGGSCGAAAKSQEAEWWHAGEEGTEESGKSCILT